MNNVRRNNSRAFTIIEVMVATVLLGIGIVAGFNALSSMTRTELRIREVEKMNLLAVQKLNEVLAIGSPENQESSGTFEDYGEPKYKWTLEAVASGTENLETVRVIVESNSSSTTDPTASASGLVFTSPNLTTGAQG